MRQTGFLTDALPAPANASTRLTYPKILQNKQKNVNCSFLNQAQKKGLFLVYPIKAKNWPHPNGITETIISGIDSVVGKNNNL